MVDENNIEVNDKIGKVVKKSKVKKSKVEKPKSRFVFTTKRCEKCMNTEYELSKRGTKTRARCLNCRHVEYVDAEEFEKCIAGKEMHG